ncbi:MAG: hypothetical protein WDA02_06720 [Saccharofermentanales bacterium]
MIKKISKTMIKKFNDFLNESNNDNIKPMFNNLPNKYIRTPYDILRSGKNIEIDGITGQIIGLKGNMVLLDIIDKNTNKHDVKEYDIKTILKKLKK